MTQPVTVAVVRVFSTEAGERGNLLGIVWSSEATRGREQQLASQIGFSETVFLDGVSDGVATIRIFTPAAELPFAGHPSVGTAWWLRAHGTPVTVLAEKAGEIAVRYDGELTWITGRAEWAPSFVWRPLATPEDVDALDPAAVVDGPDYVYAWVDEAAGILHSRMFAPHLGVLEDQATGAAAVALTARLARDLEIRQGLGSLISTRLLADGFIEVGGRVVEDGSLSV